MATRFGDAAMPRADDAVASIVAADGSGGHRYLERLARVDASNAMLADAAHFLSLLHGRYPGVIDLAADRMFDLGGREWMYRATAAFAAERAFVTRLVVAAGPVPSTPGQAQSEAAVGCQTHALSVLSQSERRGTALGAAFALAGEWPIVRVMLDRAGRRMGLEPPPCDLPGGVETATVVAAIVTAIGNARAVTFGARQLLVQHRGLWDLLEAREIARGG